MYIQALLQGPAEIRDFKLLDCSLTTSVIETFRIFLFQNPAYLRDFKFWIFVFEYARYFCNIKFLITLFQ